MPVMNFAELPRYRKFIEQRDRSLEKVLRQTLMRQSSELNEVLTHTLEVVARAYALIPDNGFFTPQAKHALELLQSRLQHIYEASSTKTASYWITLKQMVSMATYATEAEAIARARALQNYQPGFNRREHFEKFPPTLTAQGASVYARTDFAYRTLMRDVMEAVERGRVLKLALPDVIQNVIKVFPKVVSYKRPPRLLHDMREAAKDDTNKLKSASRLVFYDDDDEWQDYLDYYTSEYLPKDRFYNEPLDIGPDDEKWYSWQLEREMTHDFVSDVQKGKVSAAREAGIKDFVYIAVLDNKTDECCEWRHGLTLTEIRAKLASDKSLKEEKDDTGEPPVHFNCRCTIAPVGDVPEQFEYDYSTYNEWLGIGEEAA